MSPDVNEENFLYMEHNYENSARMLRRARAGRRTDGSLFYFICVALTRVKVRPSYFPIPNPRSSLANPSCSTVFAAIVDPVSLLEVLKTHVRAAYL